MNEANGEIIIYQTSDGQTSIEVSLEHETVGLDQYQLADLFQTDRTSINRHIRNIYSSTELEEQATCAKTTQVQQEGKRQITRKISRYNLDVIIADNALVALTLMIAESKPDEKEMMTKVVVSLINTKN